MVERDTELRVIMDQLAACRAKHGIKHIMISVDDKSGRVHGWDGKEQIYQVANYQGDKTETPAAGTAGES
ncbi:MAG: hypothetical protein PHV18_15460 [Lachnospiraceae bacterium]|nr:hypothetical protein [Lachnospiraceae bacterium]